MIKLFISDFYNNLKIMNKIIVITVFKNKDTFKLIICIIHYLLIYSKLLI